MPKHSQLSPLIFFTARKMATSLGQSFKAPHNRMLSTNTNNLNLLDNNKIPTVVTQNEVLKMNNAHRIGGNMAKDEIKRGFGIGLGITLGVAGCFVVYEARKKLVRDANIDFYKSLSGEYLWPNEKNRQPLKIVCDETHATLLVYDKDNTPIVLHESIDHSDDLYNCYFKDDNKEYKIRFNLVPNSNKVDSLTLSLSDGWTFKNVTLKKATSNPKPRL